MTAFVFSVAYMVTPSDEGARERGATEGLRTGRKL